MIYFGYTTLAGLALIALTTGTAQASCHISNETKYSFTVASGNTSNQSVGGNTTTTIAPGKIIAKSKEGKSFGGSCNEGDNLVVKEESGVVLMTLK